MRLSWRLSVHPAGDAFLNMAVDEGVLVHSIQGKSAPTLRFYEWKKPSISIGYALDAETEVNLPLCRERDVPVVRRITGGGLVFHKCDITYTVVFPEDFNPGGARKRLSVLESYRLVNHALAVGLRELGIITSLLERGESKASSRQHAGNICFSNPTAYDILYEGRKLAGGAQRRKRGWVLHQGSMLFSADFVTMCSFVLSAGAARQDDDDNVLSQHEAAGNPMARTAVCLEEILGEKPDRDCIVRVLSEQFGRDLGIDLERGELTSSEVKMAERLRREKYSTDEWNLKRSVKGPP